MNGQFIAFVGNMGQTYGPESYDKVMEWAKKQLTNHKIEKVLVGEFSCTVHRPQQIMVTPAPIPEVPKTCVDGHGDAQYLNDNRPA